MTGTAARAVDPARFTAWLCAAEVLTLLGYATYPTLLTALQAEWSMMACRTFL